MLPQLTGDHLFITDGGLETTLIFHEGLELPDFAAFDLLKAPDGVEALRRYYAPYVAIAREEGLGVVLDTPTWRASRDWGERLGYPPDQLAEANRRAVELIREIADSEPDVPTVLNGVVGPRGDGYVVGETMTADEAAEYHGEQVRTFADAGVDMVSAITMPYMEEALGIARAAEAVGVPSVISYTVETEGRLPSGQALREAIEQVDADTRPAYFMINCAHPTHFADVLEDDGEWRERIGGLRANASRMSHAELDEATELDDGDPSELGAEHGELRERLPSVCVLGGCCGTDARHVREVATAWAR
ncbi:MAG TPA: homocysteine S-methyltransferase family protein [Solirubrobacteraceae bacterium]|jgi:homocysteine S-methyltransferase|nr:homocysteine S-methyltransferase family protein [Solirubrobacteraceae bacterium]